ncbi:unnamed protein product [Symbiodinium microadriaticum]|nr:unnamed protein product [Symbiodinium microadriaticum]
MMVVGLLQDMRETYLHDASVNMLWPLLNRQARALSAVADMYMQLGHMRKSVAAARAALQKAMDMGNVRAGHADYEGYTQTRVICLRTLSESLSGLQNDASFNESIATIQEAVIIAEKLYSESVVETTRNAMLLVECLVSQLRKVPDALASILLSRRIRDVCSANSLPIESGLEQILLHYERKSSQTPMNIDSLS